MEEKSVLMPVPSLFGNDERNLAVVNKAIQRVSEAKSLEEIDTKELLIVIALHFEKTLSGLSGLRKPLRLMVVALWLIAGALWLNVIALIIQKLS